MIQLHTITNPYESLAKDKLISLDSRGVEDLKLSLATKSPHQLEITINPLLGEIYNEFLENPFIGLRIDQDDGLTLGFIKQPQGAKNTLTPEGRYIVKMISTVFLLKNTRVYNRTYPVGFTFNGATNSFFENLSSKLKVDFISPSDQESFYPSIGSVYDLLLEGADKLGNYSWRDLGITSSGGVEKVYVEVGSTQDRPISTELLATNLIEYVKVSQDLILIQSLSLEGSGETLTHLRVIGNNGAGGDVSSTFFITDKNIGQIKTKAGFSLVPSDDKLANGNILYDIQNDTVVSKVDSEVSEVYIVNLSEFQDGNEAINFDQANTVYNRAVNFLKGKNEKIRNNINFVTNKIILPGTKFKLKFAEEKINGQVTQIDDIISLGAVTYSSEDFIRFNSM